MWKIGKNHSLRFGSTMWTILTTSSVTPNKFHIAPFHVAPLEVTTSISKPAFSARKMHSINNLCNIVLLAFPLLRKHPKVCTWPIINDWNIKTKAWSPNWDYWCSGVWSPTLVKPSNFKFDLLKSKAIDSVTSSEITYFIFSPNLIFLYYFSKF